MSGTTLRPVSAGRSPATCPTSLGAGPGAQKEESTQRRDRGGARSPSAVFAQCAAADDGPTTRIVPRRAATAARPTRAPSGPCRPPSRGTRRRLPDEFLAEREQQDDDRAGTWCEPGGEDEPNARRPRGRPGPRPRRAGVPTRRAGRPRARQPDQCDQSIADELDTSGVAEDGEPTPASDRTTRRSRPTASGAGTPAMRRPPRCADARHRRGTARIRRACRAQDRPRGARRRGRRSRPRRARRSGPRR